MYNAKGKIGEADLIEQHLPLVRKVALYMRLRLPASVELDDLIGGGTFGLLDAVKKYDTSMGVKFETYARTRIHGAILDEIRKMDWVPRKYRRMARDISEAIARLSKSTGIPPSDREVAGHMGISLEEYQEMLMLSNCGLMMSYDGMGVDLVEADALIEHNGSPLEEILAADRRDEVIKAIGGLSQQEQLTLSLYYQHHLNLREIGAVMTLSESRVSQIHSKAVARLRAELAA